MSILTSEMITPKPQIVQPERPTTPVMGAATFSMSSQMAPSSLIDQSKQPARPMTQLQTTREAPGLINPNAFGTNTNTFSQQRNSLISDRQNVGQGNF